jgi:hypothetical protein
MQVMNASSAAVMYAWVQVESMSVDLDVNGIKGKKGVEPMV